MANPNAQDKPGALSISTPIVCYTILSSMCLVLLIAEVGAWRDVEVVGVGDVLRGLSAGALVWGDVDPHGGGLATRYADGSTIVVEVRASTLLECRGGWVKDAHALCPQAERSDCSTPVRRKIPTQS
jgi:hypothetical protein